MRIGTAFATLLVVSAGSLVSLGAMAADISDTDRQIAQSLFDEGRTLLEAGRAPEACPKFAESQRLDPGGGTLLNLALCHELEGRTGTAWARYQEALALALRDGRKDREEFARAHLAGLTAKLVRIVVVVPPPIAAQDPVVQLDGSRLAREAWGTAIAVDPGNHLITSQIGTNPRFAARVDALAEGRSYRVEVGASGAVVGTDPAAEPARGEAPPRKQRSTAFWLTLGGGVAALAGGGALGIAALGASRDADAGCVEARSFCTPEGREASSRAVTQAWLSTALLGAGAAAVVVAWLLPMETKAETKAAVTPVSGGALVHVSSRF
jgi:hypothetical protein